MEFRVVKPSDGARFFAFRWDQCRALTIVRRTDDMPAAWFSRHTEQATSSFQDFFHGKPGPKPHGRYVIL